MCPLVVAALIGLFSSALHFVGLCCLWSLIPTFADRYRDVSVDDSVGSTREANNTVQSTITLRNNNTRRQANKTLNGGLVLADVYF